MSVIQSGALDIEVREGYYGYLKKRDLRSGRKCYRARWAADGTHYCQKRFDCAGPFALVFFYVWGEVEYEICVLPIADECFCVEHHVEQRVEGNSVAHRCTLLCYAHRCPTITQSSNSTGAYDTLKYIIHGYRIHGT